MKLRVALAVLGSATAAATVTQAAPVSASTSAQVQIVAPNQVAALRNLQFGTIAKPTSGTTVVTVASAEADTATPALAGGAGAFAPAGGAHAATFRITGTPTSGYSTSATLTFPGSNLTGVGAEAVAAKGGTLNTVPANGQDDLFVGGHIEVTSGTPNGTYNGTLSLTVDFN
jgi:hypothetical protein